MKSAHPKLQIKNGSVAFVMINCKAGYETEVIEQLRNIEEVTEVIPTYGSYDILAKIESSTINHVRDIIIWKIKKIERIYSTTTLMRINP